MQYNFLETFPAHDATSAYILYNFALYSKLLGENHDKLPNCIRPDIKEPQCWDIVCLMISIFYSDSAFIL